MWFASFLLFLHCQTQLYADMIDAVIVVICFFFIIFALSNTIKTFASFGCWMLWFASFLLFLHCQTQCILRMVSPHARCDLLLFYYFCTVKHNRKFFVFRTDTVVICFFFIIFALSNTIRPSVTGSTFTLWFASFLLFLHCQTQYLTLHSNIIVVVICFFFIIFALSNTIRITSNKLTISCDLLLFYYFCTVKHNVAYFVGDTVSVVICFFFIIFALSNTIRDRMFISAIALWFASFLLFLHCQTQWMRCITRQLRGCDLLLFYYFCTVKHN